MAPVQVNSPTSAQEILDLMHTGFANGSREILGLARDYMMNDQASFAEWDDRSSPYTHAESPNFSYMYDARADECLSGIRDILNVRGPWVVGVWGEAAEMLVKRIDHEATLNDVGSGI